MIRYIVLFMALALTWLLWSGHYTPLVLSCGLLSCLLTVWLSRRMALIDRATVPLQLGWHILTYWLWLLKEIAVANGRVIATIVAPRLRISPTVVTVKARSKTLLGQVIFGNSITLTPGTVTLDMGGDTLVVHALRAPAPDEFDAMNARTEALDAPDREGR